MPADTGLQDLLMSQQDRKNVIQNRQPLNADIEPAKIYLRHFLDDEALFHIL